MHAQLRPLEAAFEARVHAALRVAGTPDFQDVENVDAASSDDVDLIQHAKANIACLLELQKDYGEILCFRNYFSSLAVVFKSLQTRF